MLQAFKYQWLKACTGLAIHILPDNTHLIKACTIELNKASLLITQNIAFDDIPTCLKKLSKQNPIAINITGKGVLTKKIPLIKTLSPDTLQTVFPNIKIEEFYLQQFNSDSHTWLAIIRKDVADKLTGYFTHTGFKLLNVCLGAFVVNPIIKQLNVYGETLVFDGHQISINTQLKTISDYQYIEDKNAAFPLKIGIETINEKYILAYATAFQLALCDVLETLSLASHPAQAQLVEFKEEKKFKYRSLLLLGTLFFVLLINFLVFQYYKQQNDGLSAKVSQSQTNAGVIQKQVTQIIQHQALLDNLGWCRGISFAYLLDQLGKSLAANLILSEISINPLTENRSSSNTYQIGLIKIVGQTSEINSVNDWIYTLQDYKWVKQVKLNNLSAKNEEGKQQFTIILNY